MPNVFTDASLEPVPTTAGGTVVYTVPVGTVAIIHTVQLTNIDPSLAVNATVTITKASLGNAVRTLGNLLPVPFASSLTFEKPINLAAGDTFKVQASVALRLSVFLSILEIS